MRSVATLATPVSWCPGGVVVRPEPGRLLSVTCAILLCALVFTSACGKKPADEPASDEPATDEPATGESATNEPAADEPAATFTCQKVGMGGPWRDCSPTTMKLTEYCNREDGCFERHTALCFLASMSVTGEQFTLCTASTAECNEWRADRIAFEKKTVGPCVESKVDEYRTPP